MGNIEDVPVFKIVASWMCAICLGLPLSKFSRHFSTVYNNWYSTSASNSTTIKKVLTTFEFDKNEKGYFHPQTASPVVRLAPKCIFGLSVSNGSYHNFNTAIYFKHLKSPLGDFSIGPWFYMLALFFNTVWATWLPFFILHWTLLK